MFSKVDFKKDDFLDKAKALREQRSSEKQKDEAATQIQALIRRYLVRCRLNRKIREELDALIQIPADREAEYKPKLKPAVEVFKVIQHFLMVFKEEEDQTRFEYLCKYILASMAADSLKHVYVSVMMSKPHTLAWIKQLKELLWKACIYFKRLKPEYQAEMRTITVCLHMLVTFTTCNNWKLLQGKMGDALRPGMTQLCNNVMGDLHTRGLYQALQKLLMHGLARSKPSFKAASLVAIVTIALRPLIAADFSDKLLTVFLLHILSVPAILHHLAIMSQESVVLLMTHRVFSKCVQLLHEEQSAKIVFNVLEGNYALCLLANLIQLGGSEMEGLVENTNNFMVVVTKLLDSCKKYVMNKKSNLTHWHPVLGWFSQKGDTGLHEALPIVVEQLEQLWSVRMMKLLFEQLFAYNDMHSVIDVSGSGMASNPSPSKNIFKKAIDRASKSSTVRVRLDSPVLVSTCLACKMYLTAINTLSQLQLGILSGLCCQDLLLPRLWKLITDLGPQSGLKVFLDILTAQPNHTDHMLFSLLQLGCDTASHIITILDDIELYEQGKPFHQDNLVAISFVLNQMVFRLIWNNLLDAKVAEKDPVFNSVHCLLMILYERDCRRDFAPSNHWLIREIKPSVLITELERNKKQAQFLLQKVPHIIPHKERVILFRKMVAKEKDVLGLTESACVSPQSTLITVHRGRIVEDGYRQLAALPPNALKGVIRVKFINEQGLDEAGIDQDGVFKEFLEETIKCVFDPSLNLFKVNDEQKLYPSPSSYIQENHLQLFEFVGRMLAKAVYEGIVVEVPFAPFFLSQILVQHYSKTYSSVDELPSLDPELYKNLTYVKHYDNVGDLDLTFSYDEDVMGKIVTHELTPGGRAIPVTNENKISYVHLMAHFRMRVQIKEQTAAFIRGFKSIVSSEWLAMFSPPELQKLISGDPADMDLQDLKKHTQYYGGFHSSHRVINWLWDILERDFTSAERGLFLKA